MKNLFKIATLLSAFSTMAQIPVTEIFLADIDIKNNLVKVTKAINIIKQKSYNNQPSFTPDARSILFSTENVTTKKVHISSYDIKSKKTRKVTAATQTSEYSPALAPDGQNISAVVVEEDSAQRVWLYDKVKPEIKQCLTKNTDSIGYYAWLGKDSILYDKLTNPHSLRVLDLKTGEDNWLCDNPTRSFKKIDATTFFYVIHEEKRNSIFFFDIRTKKATLFAKDEPVSQDYVWQPDLGMLKSEDSKIYRYSTDSKVWSEVADFSSYGIKIITRFAFSPDKKRMAVVSTVTAK